MTATLTCRCGTIFQVTMKGPGRLARFPTVDCTGLDEHRIDYLFVAEQKGSE